jgi:hypothetical protein
MVSAERLPDLTGQEKNFFTCKGCPYQYPITRIYLEKELFERKQVDDVLGGDEAWSNVGSSNFATLLDAV